MGYGGVHNEDDTTIIKISGPVRVCMCVCIQQTGHIATDAFTRRVGRAIDD